MASIRVGCEMTSEHVTLMSECFVDDLSFADDTTFDFHGLEDCNRGESEKTSKSRAKFTKDEDDKLTSLVSKYGQGAWRKISAEMGSRSTRQCKERWDHYLDPLVNRAEWSEDEDSQLKKFVRSIGQKWAKISILMNNRTDTMCKNRWSVLCRREAKASKNSRRAAAIPSSIEGSHACSLSPPSSKITIPEISQRRAGVDEDLESFSAERIASQFYDDIQQIEDLFPLESNQF